MFIIKCPHCNDYIFIEELNCKIFRHGVFISNGKQIDAHSSKEECDFFISNNLIYGCGKPFKIIEDNEKNYRSVICEYI